MVMMTMYLRSKVTKAIKQKRAHGVGAGDDHGGPVGKVGHHEEEAESARDSVRLHREAGNKP